MNTTTCLNFALQGAHDIRAEAVRFLNRGGHNAAQEANLREIITDSDEAIGDLLRVKHMEGGQS